MKIAVCFNGEIRTGVHAASNIKKFIGDLFDSCDFYSHTWHVSTPKDWHHASVNFNPKMTDRKKIPTGTLHPPMQQAYGIEFRKYEIENYDSWDSKFNSKYKRFSPLWYSWYRSMVLMSSEEKLHNFKYDVVIKLRPDIIFPPERTLTQEILHFENDKTAFYANGVSEERIDDVFFLGSSDVMFNASCFVVHTRNYTWYSNAFNDYLSSKNIPYKNTYNLLYTILREESIDTFTSVPGRPGFNKCFNIDRIYYAPYNTETFSLNCTGDYPDVRK